MRVRCCIARGDDFVSLGKRLADLSLWFVRAAQPKSEYHSEYMLPRRPRHHPSPHNPKLTFILLGTTVSSNLLNLQSLLQPTSLFRNGVSLLINRAATLETASSGKHFQITAIVTNMPPSRHNPRTRGTDTEEATRIELNAVRARELELKRSRGEISCAECRRCVLLLYILASRAEYVPFREGLSAGATRK